MAEERMHGGSPMKDVHMARGGPQQPFFQKNEMEIESGYPSESEVQKRSAGYGGTSAATQSDAQA